LCVGFQAPPPWESLAGRIGGGETEAAILDLPLRLAEHMAALHVPAELLPSLLALATQDVIDSANALPDDDTMAVARAAAAIPRTRIEDYVAAALARTIAHEEDASEPR
jgi:hypothetical protein